MLKLFLFLIPSGLDEANPDEAVGSFTYIDDEVEEEVKLLSGWTRANNVMEIERLRPKQDCDWYIVLYDNEYISIGLAHALRVRMSFLEPEADVLIAMKRKDGGVDQAPRVFRRFVELPEESLMPAKDAVNGQGFPIRYDRMLDGWIRDQS